jgi:hypothetical protein
MRIRSGSVHLSYILLLPCFQTTFAWSPSLSRPIYASRLTVTLSSEALPSEAPVSETVNDVALLRDQLTQTIISQLKFRELHRELQTRNLPIDGTTATLRNRLRQAIVNSGQDECIVDSKGDEQCIEVCTHGSDDGSMMKAMI